MRTVIAALAFVLALVAITKAAPADENAADADDRAVYIGADGWALFIPKKGLTVLRSFFSD